MKHALIRLSVHLTLSLVIAVSATAQSPLYNESKPIRIARHVPPDMMRPTISAVDIKLRPFYHGVASGDPSATSVVLWTRITPEGPNEPVVNWVVATDTSFANVVQSGSVKAEAAHDYCIKVQPTSLSPATVYYYKFDFAGRSSLVGRTRTLPTEEVGHVRLGVVSCSNYPAGYFNAYASLAERNDLDAIVHLGDYIYEYSADTTTYAGGTGIQLHRVHEPPHEIIVESDYNARYSQYKLDPDLMRLHQQYAFIYVYDDHETANDSYTDGAQNHNAGEGLWSDRKNAARKVCFDWMPIREQPSGIIWRSFDFGNLIRLYMLDTRLDGRDAPIEDVGDNASSSAKAALYDNSRTIISPEQYNWLTASMLESKATWNILGNQVMYTYIDATPVDTTYLFQSVPPDFAVFLRLQLQGIVDIFESAFLGDVWSNYPVQRSHLSKFILEKNIKNFVVITGDFHCSFAMDIERTIDTNDTESIGVEFMTPSISSPNFDETFRSTNIAAPIAPQLIETINRTIDSVDPHVRFMDITHHGYVVLDVLPTKVQGDFFFVDTLYARNSHASFATSFSVASGSKRLVRMDAPAAEKTRKDIPAPTSVGFNPVTDTTVATVVLNVAPNPADNWMTITFNLQKAGNVVIDFIDTGGRTSGPALSKVLNDGLHTVTLDTRIVASGNYMLRISNNGSAVAFPVVINH